MADIFVFDTTKTGLLHGLRERPCLQRFERGGVLAAEAERDVLFGAGARFVAEAEIDAREQQVRLRTLRVEFRRLGQFGDRAVSTAASFTSPAGVRAPRYVLFPIRNMIEPSGARRIACGP